MDLNVIEIVEDEDEDALDNYFDLTDIAEEDGHYLLTPAMNTENQSNKNIMRPPPPRPPSSILRNRSRRPIVVNLENDRDVIDCSESSTFLKRKRLAQIPGGDVCIASNTTCRTEDVLHVESIHGRQRRNQRRIGVLDLKAAVKYGRKTPGRKPNTSQFNYNGIVFIRDDMTGKEITTFSEQYLLDYMPITVEERKLHQDAKTKIKNDYSYWTSHSVFIVDTSGSMRNSDVHGERTRLGAVWFSLAEDFVKKRILGANSKETDVITIILMGERAKVLMEHQPTDWVLYNEICRIYNKSTVIPGGHGCYIPALEIAEGILCRNNSNACALNLTLLSDGKPSDYYVFNHSSHSYTNITIQKKVGALASKLGRRLTLATIGIGSLEAFSTLENMAKLARDYGSVGMFQLPSLSCSKLGDAFTSIATALTVTKMEMSNKTVRVVTRANQSSIPRTTFKVNNIDFNIYSLKNVSRLCYDHTESNFFQVPLQHPSSSGVAISKAIFAEGLERFTYQFFELLDDLTSVAGVPLVAKECRFVEDFNDQEHFAKRFCSMQSQAKKVAEAFNIKLGEIKRLHPKTPKVSFLDCSVYYVNKEDTGIETAVLVERKLNGEFMKWNTNNGKIFGEDIRLSETVRRQKDGAHDVYVIEEDMKDNDLILVTPDDVAQAFSHFSYNYSGKKMLICDLQGVFDENMFFFTDPVIHYYDNQKSKQKSVYGRTDRGKKGIDDFMSSHKCSNLCKLVELGFKDVRRCSKTH